MLRLIQRLMVMLSPLGVTSMALAQDLSCSGTVDNVLVYANGDVNVYTSYRKDYTVICNITAVRQGITPATCHGMMSTLIAAQASRQNIATFYSNASFTCENIPYYGNAPAPVYVGLVAK